jgi:uncharacterized RDD family membrane protein YckC
LLPAPLGRRAIAFAIDLVIVLVLAVPILVGVIGLIGAVNTAASTGAPLGALAVFQNVISILIGELLINVAIIVQLALHGRKGYTIGKLFVGIRSINVVRFDRPGFWWMVLRGLVFQVSGIVVPLLGAVAMAISPLWDPQKRGRGWLDAVGQNWLIDITNGLNPYDTKALRHARRRLEEPQAAPTAGLPSLATGAPSTAPGERSPLFAPESRSHSAIVGGAHAPDAAQVAPAAGPPPAPVPGTAPNAAPAGFVVPPAPTPIAAPPLMSPQPPPPVPRPASSEPAALEPARSTATTIVFDTGVTFTVATDGLIGRNPQAQPGERDQELISIADDTLSVSKTHAAFGIDAGGFWVSDRSSRNGIAIRSVDGASTPVATGDRAYVRPGDTVFLGQRSFVVRPA